MVHDFSINSIKWLSEILPPHNPFPNLSNQNPQYLAYIGDEMLPKRLGGGKSKMVFRKLLRTLGFLRAQLRNFGAQPVLRPPEVISSHGLPATNFQIDIEPSRRACGDPSRPWEILTRIVGWRGLMNREVYFKPLLVWWDERWFFCLGC